MKQSKAGLSPNEQIILHFIEENIVAKSDAIGIRLSDGTNWTGKQFVKIDDAYGLLDINNDVMYFDPANVLCVYDRTRK